MNVVCSCDPKMLTNQANDLKEREHVLFPCFDQLSHICTMTFFINSGEVENYSGTSCEDHGCFPSLML